MTRLLLRTNTDSLTVTVVPAQHCSGECSRDVDLAASSEGSIPLASHKTVGMGSASHPQAAGVLEGGRGKGEMETKGSKREREGDRRTPALGQHTLSLLPHFTTFY